MASCRRGSTTTARKGLAERSPRRWLTSLGADRLGKIAEGQALGATLASGGKDAVSALEVVEKKGGNDGVTWVGGDKAGGSGQKPIRIVNDVTRAGYNLLTSRSVKTHRACLPPLATTAWSATLVLPRRPPHSPPGYWGATATDLRRLPEDGDGCWRRPHPLIQETYDKKLQSLQELLSKSKPLTAENLAAAGTDALPIPAASSRRCATSVTRTSWRAAWRPMSP